MAVGGEEAEKLEGEEAEEQEGKEAEKQEGEEAEKQEGEEAEKQEGEEAEVDGDYFNTGTTEGGGRTGRKCGGACATGPSDCLCFCGLLGR